MRAETVKISVQRNQVVAFGFDFRSSAYVEYLNLRSPPQAIDGAATAEHPMTNSSQVDSKLQLYQLYIDMARQANNNEKRTVLEGMARVALGQAARFDPAAAMANTSAIAMTKVR
jgi:hypothetical protein